MAAVISPPNALEFRLSCGHTIVRHVVGDREWVLRSLVPRRSNGTLGSIVCDDPSGFGCCGRRRVLTVVYLEASA